MYNYHDKISIPRLRSNSLPSGVYPGELGRLRHGGTGEDAKIGTIPNPPISWKTEAVLPCCAKLSKTLSIHSTVRMSYSPFSVLPDDLNITYLHLVKVQGKTALKSRSGLAMLRSGNFFTLPRGGVRGISTARPPSPGLDDGTCFSLFQKRMPFEAIVFADIAAERLRRRKEV